VDFNCDGEWQHPQERIFSLFLPDGHHSIDYTTPDDAAAGETFARVRINSTGPLPPYGPADDGEVVDDTTIIFEVDYGDAPDPLYPTLDASGGPWAGIPGYFLGTRVDGELDGQPDAHALGDDNNGTDDDDGVIFLTKLIPGQEATVKVVVSGLGPDSNAEEVCGWIDFNQNGNWESTELAVRYGSFEYTGQPEEVQCTFTVPAGAALGTTYARFTVTYLTHGAPTQPDPPQGQVSGEIEDYEIVIGENGPYPPVPQDGWDYGDAPASYGSAWHMVASGLSMGAMIDAEATANTSAAADGDDTHGSDDEDGMSLSTGLAGGKTVEVCVDVHNQDSSPRDVTVAGWIDFDGNGQWEPLSDHLFTRTVHVPPFSIVKECAYVVVPQNAKPGTTFARFRLFNDTAQPGLDFAALPTGDGGEGEIEDHLVYILSDAPGPDDGLDYGDAPASYGSASHDVGALRLGDLIDGEAMAQYSVDASGDDLNLIDDEDGVKLASDLVPGHSAALEIKLTTDAGTPNAHLGAWVAVWIDYNRDGQFQDVTEAVSPSLAMWIQTPQYERRYYDFQVPATAQTGATFMRVRAVPHPGPPSQQWSSTGPGGVGEVEDYSVTIKGDGQVLPPGEIFGGVKFNDLDGDSTQDVGEPGLANWTIWIDLNGNGVKDAGEETLTNPDGSFFFTALAPGTYTVYEELQSGWTQTYPGGTGTHTIIIQAGQPVPSVAFGNRQTGGPVPGDEIIHGYKWNDLDGDGLWDVAQPVEPPLAGWTIWLDVNGNGVQDASDLTAQTDGQGHFMFPPVSAGTYVLGEVQQSGWTQTTPAGGTHTVTVQGGQGSYPMLFGNRQSGGSPSDGQICGSKWNDLNGDGLLDVAEPLLAGWKIYLDLNHNGQLDAGEPSQLTDTSGSFLFTGLAIGSYVVAEEMQSGWQQTWPGGIGTHTISIQSGIQPARVLFGNRQADGPGPGQGFDWGDAPDPTYPTLHAANGAYHTIVPGVFLGGGVDEEVDGQPGLDALGDDSAGDDEDGVFFLGPLLPGVLAEVEVLASGVGKIDAWIDFDVDGSWAQAGDRILHAASVVGGSNTLTFSVPSGTKTEGDTYARFRFSRQGGLSLEGAAPDGEVEDYRILLGEEGPGMPGEGERRHLKWSQPPIEIDLDVEAAPIFCGWDEPARSTQREDSRRQWRMDVDDFHCLGPIPITAVRWWGGHKAWASPEPPESQPTGWHVGFWANRVEDLEPVALYPERLVWSLEIPNERVAREPVGLDQVPGRLPEMCFVYEIGLEPEEWFHQAEFPANEGVFWISITAIYPVDVEQVNLWGWRTRPHLWGRGAMMPAIMGEWPTHEERLFPGRIAPIESSVMCGASQACDLCFELLTERPWVKWDQPFTGIRDWLWYTDELSEALESEDVGLLMLRQVADDWICGREEPVIAASWHGSYFGYAYENCGCDDTPKPRRPDYFLLSLWNGASPNEREPYEHPGEKIWEYEAYDYDEVLVGYDKNPEGEPNEPVFRYSVRLPEDAWFRQASPDTVYWFSVTPVFEEPADDRPYQWGWTNHPHEFAGGALFIDHRLRIVPRWQAVQDPVDRSVDMSFTLYTAPQ